MPEQHPDHRHLRRFNIPGHARYLTFSCFKRQRFLNADRSRLWLVDGIARARDKHGFRLWAWVVMPEHAHVLLWPRNDSPDVGPILSAIKKSVSNRALAWVRESAPAFLEKMADVAPDGSTTHRFWQRGAGYDRNVWTPLAIWEAIDYIHLNPVRRGLCQRPGEWVWSSIHEHVRPGAGPIAIDRNTIPG